MARNRQPLSAEIQISQLDLLCLSELDKNTNEYDLSDIKYKF